jgi:uncharacterized protein (TIGR02569 family)
MSQPPPTVIQAFGLDGTPQPLSGGRGLCWLVGDIVLKPCDDIEEVQWVSELSSSLQLKTSTAYRLATPISTVGDARQFVFKGWSASTFVSGSSGPKGRFEVMFRTIQAFHADLAGLGYVEKPAIVGKAQNRWNEADSVAWGEKTLDQVEGINRDMLQRFTPILDQLERLRLPFTSNIQRQLIHADLTGNILFDETPSMPPAIIDLTMYWRPAVYAEAIVVADSLVWLEEGRALVELYGTDELRLQLLVRALYWRCLTDIIDTDLAWIQSSLSKATRGYQSAIDILQSIILECSSG